MRVIVGRIGRPHGIRGDVVIGVRTDEPDLRFAVGSRLDIERYAPADGGAVAHAQAEGAQAVGTQAEGAQAIGTQPADAQAADAKAADAKAERTQDAPEVRAEPGHEQLTVASARWHSGQLLVSFAGITDRTAAGELTGSWLSVDTSQLPDTGDPDEFRDHELIGLAVRTTSGAPVGVVADVLHYGQDLLVVRRAGHPDAELLVPFVKAIVPEVDVGGGVLVIDPPRGLLDPAEAEE